MTNDKHFTDGYKDYLDQAIARIATGWRVMTHITGSEQVIIYNAKWHGMDHIVGVDRHAFQVPERAAVRAYRELCKAEGAP